MWIKHRDQLSPYPFAPFGPRTVDGGGDGGGSGEGDSGDDGEGEQGQDGDGKGEEPKEPAKTEPKDETDAQKLERLTAEIGRLRRENGAQRTTAKQRAAEEARQGVVNDIAKALGITKGDEPVDPEVLAQQLTSAQKEARQTRVQLSVFQQAAAEGADPAALLDSSSFLASVGDLDPTADGFAGEVKKAIAAAVSSNPRLKAETPQAGGSGGFEGNGKRDTTPRTPKSLHDAVAARLAG